MSVRGKGNPKGPRVKKEIKRLKENGLSGRKIAKALGISRNTVSKYLDEVQEDKPEKYQAPWADQLSWPSLKGKIDQGATLQEEWENHFSDLAPYVSFWREFKRRYPDLPLAMHKVHPPGERCEIDYKGDAHGLGYKDRATGQFVSCRLFGAVMCFSQHFFPFATEAEKQADVLRATASAFDYFGGVPHTLAFDNARTQVSRSHRYDPDVNKEMDYFCEHYNTAPMPTRPVKPTDKNLIENALGVFWRWAQRKVQQHTFFSIVDLNLFLKQLANEFNDRVQRKYGVSRRHRFQEAEAPKLHDLPATSYFPATWQTAKVHPDCHIQVLKNFYSVPERLRGQQLEVRVSSGIIEVFHNLEPVARHLKASPNSTGRYFTKMGHLPECQRAVKEATPAAVLKQAEDIGEYTSKVIGHLIHNNVHPLLYLRRSQGILRLAKRYSPRALEQSCQRIADIGIALPRLRDLEAIIKSNISNKSSPIIPISRGPNPFLRGQDSFNLQKEEPTNESQRT